MDWQIILVLLIVAAALGYVARQTWREWSGKKGCKSGCGCGPAKSATPALIAPEELKVRRAR